VVQTTNLRKEFINVLKNQNTNAKINNINHYHCHHHHHRSGLLINIVFAIRTQYFANRGTHRESTTGGSYEVVSQDYEAQELQAYDPYVSELDQRDTDDISQMHAGIS
jgi:hypothetical protein